jgi:hypothetical protein
MFGFHELTSGAIYSLVNASGGPTVISLSDSVQSNVVPKSASRSVYPSNQKTEVVSALYSNRRVCGRTYLSVCCEALCLCADNCSRAGKIKRSRDSR